jgi:predicted TIM-barrel fold metal-dependent hydrolase
MHLVRGLHRRDRLDPRVDDALRAMDQYGVDRAIVSPPPFPPDHRGLYGLRELTEALRGQKRLAFCAGGESLNPMLQSGAALREFTDTAEAIAAAGAAGFGELALEHFSSGIGNHPHESAPPDHPLLLALTDIAARHGMPIDIHMEAVPQDMPFPSNRMQGANPPRLTANIARLERLLDHNTSARIVWLHAGWDLTGERTVPLMRGLLERHANLAMSIKIDRSGAPQSAPFTADWIAMMRAFPERFMIGSDQFIDQDTARLEAVRRFVDGLPDDLRNGVASGNAPRIYRLGI